MGATMTHETPDLWTETHPSRYASRGAYVAVSDGTLTHCTPRRSRSLLETEEMD